MFLRDPAEIRTVMFLAGSVRKDPVCINIPSAAGNGLSQMRSQKYLRQSAIRTGMNPIRLHDNI